MEPDQEHFEAIPWCARALRDRNYIITPTLSRQRKPLDEDSLIAETLFSKRTIRACLTVYKIPPKGISWINEVQTFMTLGSGMNGGANMLHGGLAATLLDDEIGTLLTVNKVLRKDRKGYMPLSAVTVTAYLNVQYLKRIQTPQTVKVVAKCREVKGRKYFMDAWISDGEDNILAKADSLWIRVDLIKANL